MSSRKTVATPNSPPVEAQTSPVEALTTPAATVSSQVTPSASSEPVASDSPATSSIPLASGAIAPPGLPSLSEIPVSSVSAPPIASDLSLFGDIPSIANANSNNNNENVINSLAEELPVNYEEDQDNEDSEPPAQPQDPNAPKRELTEDEKYLKRIRSTWNTMTREDLLETMKHPLGSVELCRCASRMSDDQLQLICPYMTDEQIASSIPSMQLQQQGAAVQAFSPKQIRQCVKVIPSGDRQLLIQNITLITSIESDPSKSEEIQSLISFIDPLAMGMFLTIF